ncbi:hypothetical protein NIES37_14050 [Tolypothrix tenuis PCC 7101]|uniref:Uncharacterized protein n=1 Tax=Tolypothrix tenuis PCC 7101 TaxID=231146 RepID=A0A1Z4MVL0_9CYAN|nr:hypothetical protein [Aulosira sp. FACHB-113]BAY97463.1 hypothetical protein NIES37_14050 [Tolypothrix tenuis PCC 7101]BAZ72028.1 hypothetical protein NIES50_05770 [Aulosira laxa NIES-50]
MEHWQFLIQRQGDRAWHTLESPKVEIIEGRYRVLARSNRPNTDVEVRVIHSSTQEVPPKRRIQKRSRRTNAEGLMAVIPYTYFKAGIWELQCSGDLMSDILGGQSWQYNLYVRVLSQQADEINPVLDTPPDSPHIPVNDLAPAVPEETEISIAPPETVNTAPATITTIEISPPRSEVPIEYLEDAIIDQPVSPVWVKGVTAEQILQNLIEFALPTSEPLFDEEMLTDPPATPGLPPLLLKLDQETYVARWGGSLAINGQLELKPENEEVEIPEKQTLYSLELEIDLRSPLGLETLHQVRQALPNKVVPFKIPATIDIPADCESKLILADVNLYGAVNEGGDVVLLASQSFTITADVSELLVIKAELTAKKPEIVEEIPAPATAESSPGIDLSLLNLVKTIQPDDSLTLGASVPKFLPPEIKTRSPKKSVESHSGIQLPNMPPLPPIPAKVAESLTAEPPQQEESLDKVDTLAAINMDELVITNRRLPMISGTFPFLKPLPALPGGEEAVPSDSQSPKASTALDVNLPDLELNAELLRSYSQSQNQPVVEETVPRRSKLIDAYIAGVSTPTRPGFDNTVAQPATPPPAELISDAVAEVATPTLPEFDDAVAQPAIPPPPELIDDAAQTTTPPDSQLIDDAVAQTATPTRPKLVIEGNPYSSPLITQWLQSQGFSLPEPIHLLDQDDEMDVVAHQITPDEQISDAFNPESTDIELNLSFNLDADMGIVADELELVQQELETAENVSEVELTLPVPEPPPPPPRYPKIPLVRVTEEIIVDDTYIEPEEEIVPSVPEEEEEQEEVPLIAPPSPLPLMAVAVVESLPIPQLYLPEGELIAGTSVRVRIELPEVPPEVVVKLWIKDCQTRWLIDGPYILKELLPNSSGVLEVKTQLHVPFGCLEMRVEAIALNQETQQESDKISLTRSVIPPDLPNLQLEELLGI